MEAEMWSGNEMVGAEMLVISVCCPPQLARMHHQFAPSGIQPIDLVLLDFRVPGILDA